MKPLNVKSTILHKLFDLVAPHYCCSCGEIGSILCESCKYDIVTERFDGCLLCGRSPLLDNCSECRSDIHRSWCGGERSGALEAVLNSFKFDRAEAAHEPLGDILLESLPELPPDTIIVPIPTIRSHVRQRGYDHTFLLARYLAHRRNVTLARPLLRRTSKVQRGADRKTRLAQAKEAYKVTDRLEEGVPYLLVDDVVTTGATLKYAAKEMKAAGATEIWAAAVARQPLD